VPTKSEKFANLGESTLDASYTSGGTTIDVVDASTFPADGIFRIRLDNPDETIWRVDSVSGDTFTGGAEENDGNASAGVAVVQVGTKGEQERLLQSPNDGFLYSPSGVGGADSYGPIFKLTPFSATGFAWVNQGGATETVTNGVARLVGPRTGSQNLRERVKTQPSTPYTLTVYAFTQMDNSTNHDAGIHFRESGTGKIAAIRVSNQRFKVTTGTDAWAADQATSEVWAATGIAPIWLRLTHDGTDLTWQYSFDGIHYTILATRAKTADFTTAPNQIGYVVNEQGNTSIIAMVVYSWAES
jgi:hypothetical protein